MSGEYENPLPLWRPFVAAGGTLAEGSRFDFATSAVHLRVHGELEVSRILPEHHATEAALKANVNGYDGIWVQLSQLELGAPGPVELANESEPDTA